MCQVFNTIARMTFNFIILIRLSNRMSLSTPPTQIPLHVRFPNRYSGGYLSSTVTEKLKWQTISGAKSTKPFNRNSEMTGSTTIASKVYPIQNKT